MATLTQAKMRALDVSVELLNGLQSISFDDEEYIAPQFTPLRQDQKTALLLNAGVIVLKYDDGSLITVSQPEE